MSWRKIKTEGGSGGKLGHSNMSHYEGTSLVKERAKKARRLRDRKETRLIIRREG